MVLPACMCQLPILLFAAAAVGGAQSGLSRELFENWCTDRRNGVVIAGYCVEGTLAKVRLWDNLNCHSARVQAAKVCLCMT